MTPLFTKLNLKDTREIAVLGAPDGFEAELAALDGVTVRRTLAGPAAFVLAFATRQAEVDALAEQVKAHTAGDATVWIAYPKGTSRRYTCDFNRDTGWAALGEAGFEPVRQVAVDEDWTALRCRRVGFVRRLQRDPQRALTAEGRARTGGPAPD